MVTSVTQFAARFRLHLRALGSNPLVRLSDRLEALAMLAVLGTALMAFPLAAHVGDEVYAAGVRTADEQAHSRHSVDAVVTEGSVSLPSDFDSPDYVRVQWQEGIEVRTAQVVNAATVKTGATVKVWLDDAGKVVAAPLTRADAEVSGIGAAGTVWVAVVVGSVVAALVLRVGLDRSRARAWERELQLLAHNDDGWANKHT